MVSVEYREAITEVLDILYNSDDDLIGKVPKKLIDFWERNKSKTYKPNLNHDLPLSEMNLRNKTKSIITMIYLNYICEDKEKDMLKDILKSNEDEYQLELREKYNPDHIFNNPKDNYTSNNTNCKNKDKSFEMQIVEYEESIFKRIINKILKFLHIK